jgi:hypothetical protein
MAMQGSDSDMRWGAEEARFEILFDGVSTLLFLFSLSPSSGSLV